MMQTGWGVYLLGFDGDVSGPLSSTDNEIVVFDGTGGDQIKGGTLQIIDNTIAYDIKEPTSGSLFRFFTNGNVIAALADDSTFTVQGDLDPISSSESLMVVSADAEPSGNTGNFVAGINLSARRITDSDLGALNAFRGTTADTRTTGTVANGSPMVFSVNITAGATYEEVFANDVNVNVTNGSTIDLAGVDSMELQGGSGEITEVRVVDLDNNRLGTTGTVSLMYARSNATPTNQYVVNVDSNFEGNNALLAYDGTNAKAKYIPWSDYNDGNTEPNVTVKGDEDYTATLTDHYILFTTTLTADRTLTLPAASTANGKEYTIKMRDITDSGLYKLIIDGNGSETIDGDTTKELLTDYIAITLRCDGTTWDII